MTEKFENILEKCLERITEKGDSIEACLKDYPEHASQLEPLLRTAISTSSHASHIQATPEFRLKAKTRMLSKMKHQNQERPRMFRAVIWKYRWALPALLLLMLLITSGVVIGASDSIPGEPLYSVKTTMEKIRLKLTTSDVDKAKLHIQFAEQRAEEMVEISKSNKTQEMEKLADKLKNELAHTVSIVERMKSKQNWENKVEKVIHKLQRSNVLNSGSGLSNEPLYPVKIVVEDTLLKLATSETSQARFRIEFANQRIQKIVELSQNDNSMKLDELFQGVEQHLASLDILVKSLESPGDREVKVREITSMLENAATQNFNVFSKKLETATVQTRFMLERAMNRSQMYFNNELESLRQIR